MSQNKTTDQKKATDSPALRLFFADPEIAGFLRHSEPHLLECRDKLTDISAPAVDAAGIKQLRETTADIFPGQDAIALFRPTLVQALRADLASASRVPDLSVDDLVYFQLAIVIMRLASDYLSARDLFEAHKEAFIKAYPRVLSFNPLTGAVSWEKARRQMAEILEEGFRERYDDMAIENSEHFRDSRLANEALMISMMLIDQDKPQLPTSDGLEFEQECEGLLSEAGFIVERTPISGDFGADLLARRNDLTYAIQCKHYGTPVGVSAVQEVAAGCLHYAADCAVVVASSGFTAQARRLAESNSVLLIDPSELGRLEDLARALL
ncbi:MAG TPA: restriction endonuclease [Acidobacteriaceae bacterium]|nr:restriction endonuclease [Acidobacteriaceae bacterium]